MEIFKNTNFDFLGKKWPFIIASLVLSVVGIGSLVARGGPRYGIEFKGGMLLTVKFAYAHPVEKIRTALGAVLSSPPTVQTFADANNEVAIGTDGGNELELAKNRQLVVDALAKAFGNPGSGKLDLNNSSAGQLAARITDPLQRAGVQLSTQQIQDLATQIFAWRDQRGGLITKIDDLRGVPGLTPQVLTVLNTETY